MDVAHHAALDGVELVLVPDVAEIVVLRRFFDELLGLGATVDVEGEESFRSQIREGGGEVLEELGAGLEAVVGKVERGDHVHGLMPGGEDVALDQRQALALVVIELGGIVRQAPGQRLRIEVDTPGAIGLVEGHPRAGQESGAAEILTQRLGLSSEARREELVDELDVGFRLLHGALIHLVLAVWKRSALLAALLVFGAAAFRAHRRSIVIRVEAVGGANPRRRRAAANG